MHARMGMCVAWRKEGEEGCVYTLARMHACMRMASKALPPTHVAHVSHTPALVLLLLRPCAPA